MEGKQSTFTFKTLVISGAGVFATWFVGKLLDHFFKLSLLKDAHNWATDVWHWLLQDTPMQNWMMVSIFAASLSLGWVAFYYHRLTVSAYDDLEKVEKAAAASKDPSQSRLSELQTKIMWCFAHFANTGDRFQGNLLASHCQLGRLEVETGVDQLVEKGLLKWTVYNSLTGGRTPSLTLKGKESALAIYSASPPIAVPPTPKLRISDLKPQQDND